MKSKLYIICLLFFLFFNDNLFSQDSTSNVQIKVIDTQQIKPQVLQNDTLKPKAMTKSPMGAIARSLILPGWGQYYVESYWKIPVFIGGMGFLAYLIIDNNNKYNAARKEVDNYPTPPAYDFHYDYLIRKREYFRDNRDQSIFIMVGVYILAAVDSYVGAHLYDFNVSNDLSLNIIPKDMKYLALNLQIKF
ncbi:MAG: DUF5683 domain-containing protein [Chloroherpetonaceae bacterium]|jgi:hypothetical protein|nr:DUF5683 domain-containing protein [bacterium]